MKCWIIEKDGKYYNNSAFREVPHVFTEKPKAFNGTTVIECELVIPKTWQVIKTFENMDIKTGIQNDVIRFKNGVWEEFK